MILIGLVIKGNVHYKCGNCDYYIGSDDTAIQWTQWNYCPRCGKPLYIERSKANET